MFLCIASCVSSSPGDSSVSKLSQTGKEGEVLSNKAKHPESGKLTEADKASTGRVGRGIRAKTSSRYIYIQYVTV